tara:strand:+ start:318 stop:869 length:552 start_codon:yes stop_codon:yes gene_type:complete
MKEINYIMTLLPYVGSVINLGNSFSQATRPKNVGQMSDLIQEYRESTDKPTRDGWESFYNNRIGLDKIDIATDKTWDYVQRIKENLNSLTRNDVYEWEKDLIIDKTFAGLQVQLDILEMVSETGDYRLSTPEEESKGIDGVVDGRFVSIKPNSYKSKREAGQESIEYDIIYYKNTKKGLVVTQ